MALKRFPVNSYPVLALLEPAVLPNSAADAIAVDCILQNITLTNYTAGAITVTITDKQSTPRDLLKDYSIPAKTTVVFSFPGGRFMTGGFQWVASAATSIVGSFAANVK